MSGVSPANVLRRVRYVDSPEEDLSGPMDQICAWVGGREEGKDERRNGREGETRGTFADLSFEEVTK